VGDRFLKAPVFVVGVPRSGTTFLAQSLGRHPNLWNIPRETQFMPGFFVWLEQGVALPAGQRVRIAQEFLGGWLGAVARRSGKPRVVEKTPLNVLVINWLLACFPDAQVVHIHRDPRDVVASIRTSEQLRLNRPSVPFAAQLWRDLVCAAVAKGNQAAPGRYAQVRYEDLVANPGLELGRLLAFLGERVEPVLSHVLEATDHTRLERWRDVLTPPEVDTVERTCAEVMAELGYVPSLPRASQ
jgi:hypothetical protein